MDGTQESMDLDRWTHGLLGPVQSIFFFFFFYTCVLIGGGVNYIKKCTHHIKYVTRIQHTEYHVEMCGMRENVQMVRNINEHKLKLVGYTASVRPCMICG